LTRISSISALLGLLKAGKSLARGYKGGLSRDREVSVGVAGQAAL
jgi:hypothetical protein